MFEKYKLTDRARHALTSAQEEARNLKHHTLGTEHVLLGLLREEHGAASWALKSLGITYTHVRQVIKTVRCTGQGFTVSEIQPSVLAQEAMIFASLEADHIKKDSIDTEHILLGLLREEQCSAVDVLKEIRGCSRKTVVKNVRLAVGRAMAEEENYEISMAYPRFPAENNDTFCRYNILPHRWYQIPGMRIEVRHESKHVATCVARADGSLVIDNPEHGWATRVRSERERLIAELNPVIAGLLANELGFHPDRQAVRLREHSIAIASAMIDAGWRPAKSD